MSGHRDPDPEFKAWVERAKAGSFETAMAICGFRPAKGFENAKDRSGPCPNCGGRDRFSVLMTARKFNCRKCEAKGLNAVSLAMVGDRISFLDACRELTGEDPPRADCRESAEEKAERERRRAAQDRKNAEDAARAVQEQNAYRERERAACHRIWGRGRAPTRDGLGRYYAARNILLPSTALIREADNVAFFHGEEIDDRGQKQPRVIYRGPAQLAAMLDNDGQFVGLHITHLAPDWCGKAEIFCPETGELLNAKKMRGSKKGTHIVVRQPDIPQEIVYPSGTREVRMFLGEGNETVVSVGTALKKTGKMRLLDTFWGSGDLGNLGGPNKGTISHPTAKTEKGRPVRVPSAEPDFTAPGILIPDYVTHLFLLGDGDSEPFLTRTTLERARRRYARPGLWIGTLMADDGRDFNDMVRAGV